MTTKKCLC